MRRHLGLVLASSLAAAGCAPSFDLGAAAGAEGGACEGLAPHAVQGSGSESPLIGQSLRVSGIVSLVRDGPGEAAGFFLQSTGADADPLTSEGLFVAYAERAPAREARIAVVGTVAEVDGVTVLGSVEQLDECGRAALPAPAIDALGLGAGEAFESMWVRARADWSVVDTSRLLRDGRLELSPRGRWFAPGHALGSEPSEAEPWTLRLPGGRGDMASLPRLGSALAELQGVVHVEGQTRELFLAAPPDWSRAVPPPPARARGTTLRVVGLNLDNYFVDLDGPGARSEPELSRQRDKLVALLGALDADILALTELENDGSVSLSHLLEGLSAGYSRGLDYAFSSSEPPRGATLRAAIAYRPERARPLGEAWFDAAEGFRRPPVFQSFEAEHGVFTLGVVHFKSKRCEGEPTLVPSDGCGSDTRRAEAELLAQRLGALEAGGLSRGVPSPLLVIGDFNSDSREPTLTTLREQGLVDLLDTLPGPDRYSYVFDGRASLLDHALANPSLADATLGAALWHIDADEPAVLGYSLDNPPGAYAPDARRASDHDPVVIDLGL